MMVSLYCVKDKAKKEIDDSKLTKSQTKNGRNMLKGVCPDCGTTVVKFVK